MWHKPFPMLVASRGAGKSFLLAVYCVLRALLEPKTKIVIVGADPEDRDHGNSKLLFQLMRPFDGSQSLEQYHVRAAKETGRANRSDRYALVVQFIDLQTGGSAQERF
jgi:hypothetical protein